MQRDIQRVLIDRHALAKRVEEIASKITADLGVSQSAEEPDLILVPILTGSVIFLADLMRCLPLRMRIRLISVTSYPGATTVSKGARLEEVMTLLPPSLAGASVLVIDDILDSGSTLRLVTDLLRARNPASLRVCILLRKQRPEAMAFPIDYVGFDIPDEFVVGYGLDYNDYYRNLPDVVTLRPEVIRK